MAKTRSGTQDISQESSRSGPMGESVGEKYPVLVIGNSGTLAFGPVLPELARELPRQAGASGEEGHHSVNYLVAMP